MSKPAIVLIIEDDLQALDTVRAGLAREGSELVGVTTGEQGLDVVESRRVDLILLDLGLPDMDGFAVLEKLKASPATANIPILLLTAHNTTTDKVRAFDAGASDYITKPFDVPELRARVRATLRAKRLQDELAETNRQLEAARVAAEAATRAKSEFLAQMSHEIRTPMNGVICMSRLLMESKLTPQQKESVETIHTSADALLTIINDILDFSKIESGKLALEDHPFELTTCIEDVLDLLSTKAEEKGLELTYKIEPGVPPLVTGDSTRLRQVLLNLVSNGLKFTAKGGVSVRAWAEPVPTQDRAWRLCFSVRDTGIGIARDHFDLLFKSFSQVDSSTTRQYGGTGLGLAICKSLVTIMGGDISVESDLGRGSTFHFHIKVLTAPASERPQPKAAPPPPAPSKPGATLAARYPLQMLLVDDNVINQKVALRLLQQIGYKADVAANGLEAVEAVKLHPYDIVLMDVQMPELDGMDATRRIRQLDLKRASPVVIAMTANAMHGDREKCLAAGMDDYVSKPIEPAKLVKAIETWASRIHSGQPKARAPSPAASPKPAAVAVVPSAPPVNLQRLEQFTDGTVENLRELVDLYLGQTAEQLADLEKAIIAGKPDAVRRLAHKAAGSSSTCGMDALSALLREIENQAFDENLAHSPTLFASAQTEFARVQKFLGDHLTQRAGR